MVAIEDKLKAKGELKESIIETTKLMILQEGWQSVSIRKIADAIGYSLPMVYKFFESKDALQEEFVKIGFGMLADEVALAQKSTNGAEQQLHAMASAYINFAYGHRAYYQLMFGLGIPSCQKAKEIAEIGRFGCTLKSVLNQLIVPENEDRAMLKFHTLWSILHGLISINMVGLAATPNQMQQHVMRDAVAGFIKNINY